MGTWDENCLICAGPIKNIHSPNADMKSGNTDKYYKNIFNTKINIFY
jgi:hypothetical protein